MLQTSFVQPYFAANHLALTVQPVEGGGFETTAPVKLQIRLNSTGLYEFVGLVDRLRKTAIEERKRVREANTLREFFFMPKPTRFTVLVI